MAQQNRREFLAGLSCAAVAATASLGAPEPGANQAAQTDDRPYWVATLKRVAEPVLRNLAENRLRLAMPVEAPKAKPVERRTVTHLEAFGRTLDGVAPWIELAEKPSGERELGAQFAEWARRALANATDPSAPDYLNFNKGGQPLVDAAFLAQALLRARHELWDKLPGAVQTRLVDALISTRAIKPGRNNWLLFSAMIETFLASVGAHWLEEPIDTALSEHEQWYKGDGVYGDGPEFHWDYYNSYVIQPFMIDVLEHIDTVTPRWSGMLAKVKARARRYAVILERLIAPDGSYPALGRSLAYRCGAFHLLAQNALRNELDLKPGQARCALTAVIRRTLDAPGTFDPNGWLQAGLCGHQPGLAESYISTGSLYLCTFAFLPLGLPPGNAFWSDPPVPWTSQRLWGGEDLLADHALSSKG